MYMTLAMNANECLVAVGEEIGSHVSVSVPQGSCGYLGNGFNVKHSGRLEKCYINPFHYYSIEVITADSHRRAPEHQLQSQKHQC